MPPRWLRLTIVLFWLTTSAVFFRHEYWPYLEPDAPPPFAVDLLDETRNPVPVSWKVSHNGEEVLAATTKVEHRQAENDFKLRASFGPIPTRSQAGLLPRGFTLHGMVSIYRVNPEGQLLGLETTVRLDYNVAWDKAQPPITIPISAQLWGDVVGDEFAANYSFTLLNGVQEGKLPRVKVSSQGAVMLPLHPLNHIRGLRPGQTWRIPFADPLGDALASMVPSNPTYLQANVLPETQRFVQDQQEVECLVIEYTSDELSARTWVRRSDDPLLDGLVLQQEVTRSNDTWVMTRR